MDRASDFWRDVHAHELSHGLYLTDNEYRKHCENFWDNVMTDEDRKNATFFLAKLGYNQRRVFVISEFQAYLVYSRSAREKILRFIPEKRYEELRAAFIKDSPAQSFQNTIDRLIKGEQ